MWALSLMFRLLNEHPQKTLLKSSHLIKYLPNFPSKKIPESKNCKPKKIPQHPRHLKSGVLPWDITTITIIITVPKGTDCATLFIDVLPNLDLTIIPYRCSVIQIILFSIHSVNSFLADDSIACATDKFQLWLSPSAKQCRNLCSGPSNMYQDLSTCHDWNVKKAIVDLPIRMTGNSKCTSGNLLSLSGAHNKDVSAALQMLLTRVK